VCLPTAVDDEVEEMEDLLRRPAVLGHPTLDSDQLYLKTEIELQKVNVFFYQRLTIRCAIPDFETGHAPDQR
jgi:hypothetical protein